MNEHPFETKADQLDDLHDRLMDASLRELLGSQQPPDLSARILAAAAAPAAGAAAVVDVRSASLAKADLAARRRTFWSRLAVAASVLALAGLGAGLFLPALQPAREAARRSPNSETSPRWDSSSEPTQPTPKNDSGAKLSVRTQASQAGGQVSGKQGKRWGDLPPKQEPLYQPPTNSENSPLELPAPAASVADYSNGSALPGVEKQQAQMRQNDHRDPGSGPVTGGSVQDDQRTRSKLDTKPYSSHESASLQGKVGGQKIRTEAVPGDREKLADGRPSRFGQEYKNQTDELLAERSKFVEDRKAFENSQAPGRAQTGDRYRRIVENAYLDAVNNPLSTFSIDVDTASYANVRQFLMHQGVLPPADAVRIEELINYFRYDYAGPEDGRPFASHVEVADCPWQPRHKLVRVAIKGREVAPEKRPQANLVFLIDVSGSMNEPNKLPLLVQALKMLTQQLRSDDRVAIVVYAGNSGLVLPSTPGESRETILTALDRLRAGGSTNGGAGIELAYKVAKDNHVAGGINRVILCTDGDFNVGVTSDSSLERLIEQKRSEQGTFLTVLGFGRGNFNDSMLEALSGKGNGNYAYVDNIAEARKLLVEQLSGTLMTIAKDVKIQIEFNPARVTGYRLLGYEDRILAAEDFNNDKKDAGEIGSGHTVTALYEIVPTGVEAPAPQVDALKYQKPKKVAAADEASELMTLKIRYKEPTAEVSQKIEVPIRDEDRKFAAASSDFQFAAAVAGFGMLLRDSEYKGTLTYDAVLEIAAQHQGKDPSGYRHELLDMVRKAKQVAGK